MRTIKIIYGLLLIFLIGSCKSQITESEKLIRDDELNKLVEQIEEGTYQIKMATAFPLNTSAINGVLNGVLIASGDSASRIDLTDRNDFIELDDDAIIKGELSYYGERRIAGGNYGDQNTGISFKAVPTDYKSIINYEKGYLDIDYDISNQTESFNVSIDLYVDGNATISISSSHRSSIRYAGKLEKKEQLEL